MSRTWQADKPRESDTDGRLAMEVQWKATGSPYSQEQHSEVPYGFSKRLYCYLSLPKLPP